MSKKITFKILIPCRWYPDETTSSPVSQLYVSAKLILANTSTLLAKITTHQTTKPTQSCLPLDFPPWIEAIIVKDNFFFETVNSSETQSIDFIVFATFYFTSNKAFVLQNSTEMKLILQFNQENSVKMLFRLNIQKEGEMKNYDYKIISLKIFVNPNGI